MPRRAGATLVTRDELFSRADYVSVHVVLSPRSRGMVGSAELALMKPTAYLINTSRGPIVDEAALIDALERKAIAGAGLDVFDVEPLPLDHALPPSDQHRLGRHTSATFRAKAMRFIIRNWSKTLRPWLDGTPVRQILSTVVPDKLAHAPK